MRPYIASNTVLSKNAVSANIKYSLLPLKRQISGQSTAVVKRMYRDMYDNMVDVAFTYGRALVVWLFHQETFKVKESTLHEI